MCGLACAISALAQGVTIGAPVATLAAPMDLSDASSGGAFTSFPANATYVATVSTAGTPDRFTWTKNGGSASSPAAIAGGTCALPAVAGSRGWQPLADGVVICWLASTGHTLADSWFIAAQASGSLGGSSFVQGGVGAVVARNGEDKMRERVTPEDYDARGVPFIDSIPIQKAEAYLVSIGGGTLDFGAKTYACNFLVDSNIWLRGAGTGGTTLISASGSNADVIQGRHFLSLVNTAWRYPETRGDNFVKITDMVIDGDKANNSAGYGIRIWGDAMYWDNVTVQNAAQDGIFTQYSDSAGPALFPVNPSQGDPTSYFRGIKMLNNGGNGWTYNGPHDSNIFSPNCSGDGGWCIQTSQNVLQGTVTTSGTTMTWSSGSVFTGLNSGDQIEIDGPFFTIASCSSSTVCTLTAAPATHSSPVSALAYFWLGALDAMVNVNCYHEGSGCFNFGFGANPQSITVGSIAFSPICIQTASQGGLGQLKLTHLAVFACPIGVILTGGENRLTDSLIFADGVGVILDSVLNTKIDVAGDSNGLAIEDALELGPNSIIGSFDTPFSLDDATSGGTYTAAGPHQYTVQITTTGTPDTFQWQKDGGAWTTGVSITGSAQTLTDGVTITLAATTGHTGGTTWIFYGNSMPSVSVSAATIERAFLGLPLSNNSAAKVSALNVTADGADNYSLLQQPGLIDRTSGQILFTLSAASDSNLVTTVATDPAGNTTVNSSYGPLAGIWAPSTVFGLGVNIHDANGHIMTVTTAGTSGAIQPNPSDSGLSSAWNENLGSACTLGGSPPCATIDGSVIWTDTVGLAANLYLMNAGGDVFIGPNSNVAAPYRFRGSGNAIDLGCQLFPAASCSWGLNNGTAGLSLLLFGHLNAGCPDCGGIFSTSDLYFGPNSQSVDGFRVSSGGTGLISWESFSGSPNGAVSAGPGSLGFDTTGNIWAKQTGYGNTGWVNLTTPGGVTSLGGATGAISLGAGLTMTSNTLVNSGVTAINGATGSLAGGSYSITYTSCTTISGGIPSGCSNVTKTVTDGLLQ